MADLQGLDEEPGRQEQRTRVGCAVEGSSHLGNRPAGDAPSDSYRPREARRSKKVERGIPSARAAADLLPPCSCSTYSKRALVTSL